MHGEFEFRRRYCGKLKAVIFDWAGTLIDYGSRAPAGVFVEVFKQHGVSISLDEARLPMGMEKRAHIEALAALPGVAGRWQAAHGRPIQAADIDLMYQEFLPLQLGRLASYAELIPGTLDVVATCRRRGIKVGTSTGYSRQLMDVVEAEARRRGLVPDAVVCADDVPAGRPAPWMCFENARRLDAWPVAAIVKVDDTIPGIEAGLNAAMWTVAVAVSGNEMGLSQADVKALPPSEYEKKRHHAYARLRQSGAHYVVDSIADLPPVLDAIESRLARGARP